MLSRWCSSLLTIYPSYKKKNPLLSKGKADVRSSGWAVAVAVCCSLLHLLSSPPPSSFLRADLFLFSFTFRVGPSKTHTHTHDDDDDVCLPVSQSVRRGCCSTRCVASEEARNAWCGSWHYARRGAARRVRATEEEEEEEEHHHHTTTIYLSIEQTEH